MSSDQPERTHHSDTPAGAIVASWVIVAIPLLYGLIQTLKNALKLFTG